MNFKHRWVGCVDRVVVFIFVPSMFIVTTSFGVKNEIIGLSSETETKYTIFFPKSDFSTPAPCVMNILNGLTFSLVALDLVFFLYQSVIVENASLYFAFYVSMGLDSLSSNKIVLLQTNVLKS